MGHELLLGENPDVGRYELDNMSKYLVGNVKLISTEISLGWMNGDAGQLFVIYVLLGFFGELGHGR